MTDAELRDEAVKHLTHTNVSYPVYKQHLDHGDYTPKDGSQTEWGKAFASLAQIGGVTPPPGSPSAPLPPRAPITSIVNAPSIALNLYALPGRTYSDYVVDGTGDSAVLLNDTTHGNTIQRFKMTRVAAGNSVTWAKHGVYCKSNGNTLTDFDATASQFASDGISCRMGGNRFQRMAMHGFIFPFAYFEHDDQPGVVTVEDFTGDGRSDTAIWGDDSNGCTKPYIKQAFVFRRCWFTVPGAHFFLKFGPSVFSGAGGSFDGAYVHLENCRLNGQPVTAGQISGVPSSKLTIA